MEQQKLPNVTIAIVLSIIGFVCCCIAGLPGIIFGGIALFLISKDEKLYRQQPENFTNYNQLKTAKILAWIAFILGVLYLAWSIFGFYQAGGWEGYMQQSQELMEQWGIEE
ncbi:CCC motif membrane protein [Pricia sp. S334]|uniref:CCC motif membrane protein n=1 Tax=Pricia mediterranea TaxID=3076079 RepID=A0ABU3L880_9FLAO|nr:CCC motif membrane protein [Pricia sp. S334]MDT7829939.1 CCC motif membrane protein [Pricia sp. S334]